MYLILSAQIGNTACTSFADLQSLADLRGYVVRSVMGQVVISDVRCVFSQSLYELGKHRVDLGVPDWFEREMETTPNLEATQAEAYEFGRAHAKAGGPSEVEFYDPEIAPSYQAGYDDAGADSDPA